MWSGLAGQVEMNFTTVAASRQKVEHGTTHFDSVCENFPCETFALRFHHLIVEPVSCSSESHSNVQHLVHWHWLEEKWFFLTVSRTPFQ